MDSLNDIRKTLVSINNIMEKRKESIGDSCNQPKAIDNVNSKRELLTESSLLSGQLNSTGTARQSNHLHLEPLTEENFHRAHLCNRSIDELPNISIYDIKQLKSINIYTMQDLLGRFLIHDTLEEFHTFLCSTFRLSEKTATTITNLFHRWTKHNLDGIIDSRQN